jgi:Uma2 family endonuclease
MPSPSKAKVTRPRTGWTQAEFRRLPEGPPYYELEDGVLIEMARPRGRHQKIASELIAVLVPFLKQNNLGVIWPEVEVDITPTRTYVPDLSYLSHDHLDRFVEDVAIVGPPDLVVEISSPSTAARDNSIKLETYQQTGVPWCWIIDTETLVIHEYKNTAEGYLLAKIVAPGAAFAPAIFPGLTFNLAELMGESEAPPEVAVAETNS